MAYCAVACGINVVNRCLLVKVGYYTLFNLAARIAYKLCVRPYADSDYKNIKIHRFAVCQLRTVF